jgi:hypothetical protein
MKIVRQLDQIFQLYRMVFNKLKRGAVPISKFLQGKEKG